MFLARLLPSSVLSKQARKPSGFIGRFIISSLLKKGNNDLNNFVFKTLKLQPSDHVLEIGFGPGHLINNIASIIPDGHVSGIDFSELMIEEASKINEKYISEGKVALRQGDCRESGYKNESFNKVCAVNTLYFWNPVEDYLSEIFRVLKPGGQVILGIRSAEQMETLPLDSTVFTTYSLGQAVELLSNTGFINTHVAEEESNPFTSYCIVGTKP